MGREDISDAQWELIGPLLPSGRGRWARPAGDNRRFLNGMLHVLRVRCPWRDMHERLESGLGLYPVPTMGRAKRMGRAASNAG